MSLYVDTRKRKKLEKKTVFCRQPQFGAFGSEIANNVNINRESTSRIYYNNYVRLKLLSWASVILLTIAIDFNNVIQFSASGSAATQNLPTIRIDKIYSL